MNGRAPAAAAAGVAVAYKRHSISGHRVLGELGVGFRNSTLAHLPMTTFAHARTGLDAIGALRPTRAHRRISTTSVDANRTFAAGWLDSLRRQVSNFLE